MSIYTHGKSVVIAGGLTSCALDTKGRKVIQSVSHKHIERQAF